MDSDTTLGRVTVVLELQSMVVLRISVFRVVCRKDLQRGETKGRSLEVNKCLESRGSLVCLYNKRNEFDIPILSPLPSAEGLAPATLG